MPDHCFRQITGLLLGIMLPLFTHAGSDKLYRVEMLIFSNPGGSSAEKWDATPALSYPARSRMLVAPDQLPETASASQRKPTPFITLPHSELEFRGAAARMQRDGRYRKLFHEAWTQTIPAQSRAIPIVLDHSGDGGPWPPLQGSVRLYISRYIYLETNLWLNTSGEYLHSDWRMPAPPLGPSTYAHTGVPAEINRTSTPAANTETPDSAANEWSADEWFGPEYPYGHAVLLNETRRMRSTEVNYIDHPMFGLVIKVTPVQVVAESDDAG